MKSAEEIMTAVWKKIIGEVRRMRDNKYTLERIGNILGVAGATVQRWLEGHAGGEKTAFIDIMRYVLALHIDLRPILFEETAPGKSDAASLSVELLKTQRELLQAREKIISVQEKMLKLEQHSLELLKQTQAPPPKAGQGKTGMSRKSGLPPGCFPDLPPIHLYGNNV
jgi:transcriptional regulator with XRE-family HTH domain